MRPSENTRGTGSGEPKWRANFLNDIDEPCCTMFAVA
uniref:Uncharacterized protein n=1 Tax=Triticum urartu TaxID=4572 RepID=A0A8R7JX57_TRIUA